MSPPTRSRAKLPELGAVHANHTEWLAGQKPSTSWLGSPGSAVAPRVVPNADPVAPVIVRGAAKKSFGGGRRQPSRNSPAYPFDATAIE